MAILKGGILDQAHGKIGNVVVFESNGKTILRTKATNIHKPTKGRLPIARKRFGSIAKMMSICKSFINEGYMLYNPSTICYRAAVSYNFALYDPKDKETIEPDYSKIKLSLGGLSGSTFASAVLTENNRFKINWSGMEQGKPGFPYDKVMLLVFSSKEPNSAVIKLSAGLRSDEEAIIQVPGTYQCSDLHFYMAFFSYTLLKETKARDFVSDSQYVELMP